MKNIGKNVLNNTFKLASFYIYFMSQKMYLYNIEVGYTYQCSIRIDNNKKAKKFKIEITSREFVSFSIASVNETADEVKPFKSLNN